MPSAAFLFVVFAVVGPSDLGLCLTGALHYTNIVGFSDVLEPFEITSERDLESVSSWTGIRRLQISPSSDTGVAEMSNRSLKVMTSPAMAERTTRLGLYDLKLIRRERPWPSASKQMWPSCVDRSWLLSNEASAKPTT